MKNTLKYSLRVYSDFQLFEIIMQRLIRKYSTVASSRTIYHVKSFDSIPGPKAFPILGTVPHYLPGIGKYDPQNVLKSGTIKFHEFGPIIKERFFGHEAVFLYDPEDIEALFRLGAVGRRSHLTLGHIRKNSEHHENGGILYENGPAWYKLRSGSQQSLTLEGFQKYLPKIDEITLKVLNNIKADPITQKAIDQDFLLVLLAFNCDAVLHMLFGMEANSIQDIFNEEALTTKVIHSSSYFNRMMAPMDNGLMLWKIFPTKLYKQLKKCSEDVDAIPIEQVKRMLMNRSKGDEGKGILQTWIKEAKLGEKIMVTILSDLLLAGIDTTSYTLAFTLYNLSVNKRVQKKLFKELCELQPSANLEKNSSVDASILGKASYLKKVVKESMRLFPVSVGTSRVLDKPCVIGGYEIPANVTIITMNQVTCRLEKYVERANEFIPERYEGEGGNEFRFKKIRPYTSLPFGHGPRACIGRRVAELTMYTFLFRLLRNFEIEWVGEKPLGCVAHSITEPDGPLHFRFNPRPSN